MDVTNQFDVIIVGGGPAGLAAGLYAARMELRAILLDQGPSGGQLLNTELIEDYPGFESILGHELASKMAEHARSFGLEIIFGAQVREIDGDQKVRGLRYVQDGVEKHLAVGGVFVFVGFLPTSQLLKPHVEHAAAGYLVAGRNMQTSIPGIWAVGDVRA